MENEALYASLAELYDKIYDWKNYVAEADKLRELLSREGIDKGSSILEAACGTGTYLALLRGDYDVAGFDRSPAMLAIARAKLGDVRLFEADMRRFEIERPVDALLCLFSSIGYLLSDDDIREAARAFAKALRPGGVALVEPWLAPSDCTPGHVSMHATEDADLKLCRQGFIRVEGNFTILEMNWLIGRRNVGVTSVVEMHRMRMIEPASLVSLFESEGLDARFDPASGLMPKRGMLIAKKR